MPRVFTDRNLLTWEAFSSGGRWGLPDHSKIIFNCLSHQDERGRYVVLRGDNSDAEAAIMELPEEQLLNLLATSKALD